MSSSSARTTAERLELLASIVSQRWSLRLTCPKCSNSRFRLLIIVAVNSSGEELRSAVAAAELDPDVASKSVVDLAVLWVQKDHKWRRVDQTTVDSTLTIFLLGMAADRSDDGDLRTQRTAGTPWNLNR